MLNYNLTGTMQLKTQLDSNRPSQQMSDAGQTDALCDGGDFFDGPANFSTSQNPPGRRMEGDDSISSHRRSAAVRPARPYRVRSTRVLCCWTNSLQLAAFQH